MNRFERIVEQILRTNKIERDELMSRIKKKREDLYGFITLEGCAILVAEELGIKIDSKKE